MSSTGAVPRLERLPSRLLARAALVASRLVADALAEVDGHRYEFAVLVTLDEIGPASQRELCHRCDIDPSDMTDVVGRAEDAGYVTREADPADARRKLVHLGVAGRERLAVLEDAIASAQDALLEGWSPTDRERLVSLLLRLATQPDP